MLKNIFGKLKGLSQKILPKRFSRKQSEDDTAIPTNSLDNTGEVKVPAEFENQSYENTETPIEASSNIEEANNRLKILNAPLGKIKNILEPVSGKFFDKIKVNRADPFSTRATTSKLNFNKFYDLVFNPESRGLLHKTFLGTLVVTSAFVVGKITALTLKGKEVVPPALSPSIKISKNQEPGDYNDIKLANIFNANDLQTIKSMRSNLNLPCELADARSSSALPIKLVNTVVLQDSIKSIASIQVRGGKLSEIREGEKLENIAKIDKIDRLRLIFRNLDSNLCEYISNATDDNLPNKINILNESEARAFKASQTNPDIVNVGNTFTIKRKFINEKLKDINTILTQAKAIPITNPDGTMSFKVTEVDPGGVFASLNIQAEDTITTINGKKITSLNEVMNLFGKLGEIEKLSINVLREGEEKTLDYTFSN